MQCRGFIHFAELSPIKLYIAYEKGSQLLSTQIFSFILPLGGSKSNSKIHHCSIYDQNKHTRFKDCYVLSHNCHTSKFSINHQAPQISGKHSLERAELS